MMLDKDKIKQIYELCVLGDFEKALEILKTSEELIKDNIALKVIINICNACASNIQMPEKICDEYLYQLLAWIVPHLKQPDESQMLSYSQAIFHILKMLLLKKSCIFICRLDNVWLPNFLASKLPKKIEDNYQKIVVIIHNFISKSVLDSITLDGDTWLKLNMLISRICKYLPHTVFFQLSHGCLHSAKSLKIATEIQEIYYFELLQFTKDANLPNSETFDYIWLYTTMVFLNMLHLYEFKKAIIFYERIAVLWKVFAGKEYVYLHRLLKFPLLLSSLEFLNVKEEIEKCSESLTLLNSVIPSSNIFQKVLTNLCSFINTVIKYYKEKKVIQWPNFSSEVRLDVYELFLKLAQHEKNSNTEEKLFRTVHYAECITTSISCSISQSDDIPDCYHKKSVEFLQTFFNIFHLLKQMNNEKWKTAWNTVGIAIYNIGVHLYNKPTKAVLYYFNLLIKEYIRFDGPNCLKLKFSMLLSSLNTIYSFNADDYRKQMAYAALSIVICPNEADHFMANFIKVKHAKPEPFVQTVTLVSAFTIFKKELNSILGADYILTIEDKKRLLMFELQQYKKKWKSKIPMMHALKELYGTADLDNVVNAVVEVFGDIDMDVHEDVPMILNEICRKYEEHVCDNGEYRSKFCLSVLYMLQYKYRFKEIMKRNASDMARAMSVVDEKNGMQSDPSEECDIVSAYESLILEGYLKNMSLLDKSLSLVSLMDIESMDNIEMIFAAKIHRHLLRISYEYKLHMHKIKSLQALQMALKIAEKEKDSHNIVKTTALIMDSFDIGNAYVKYLMQLAENEMGNLDINHIDYLQTILMFLIAKTKLFLYIDPKEALKILLFADKMLEEDHRKNELALICSQLLLLKYKLVLMPCKLQLQDHKKDTLVLIHKANSVVLDTYRNKQLDAYELCILLDTVEEFTKFYHMTRCPREVRSYSKETALLTQKLVLPLRSVVFLKYLAHADLKTGRINDCKVKVNGMGSILCLSKYKLSVPECSKETRIGYSVEEDEQTTDNPQEMVLDQPQGYFKQMSPSSPGIYIEPVCSPAFLQHDVECNCYYCTCLEYQSLIIDKIRLDGLLHWKCGHMIITENCFEGAYKLYKVYQTRREYYQETCEQFVRGSLIPDYDTAFLSCHASNLLDYSHFLFNTKRDDSAIKINLELIELLLPKNLELIHLWNEALVQKLLYLSDQNSKLVNPIPEIDELTIEDRSREQAFSKTPETGRSEVKVETINYTPVEIESNRRVKKCLSFATSPEDTMKTKQIRETTKVNTNKKTSKIKIYTENTEQIARKKFDCPNIIVHESDGAPSTSHSLVDVQSDLRTRTKLLTKKIKDSSKKSGINNAENISVNKQKCNVKANLVKKNLIDMERDKQNTPGSGIVRRSQRTKKL